MSETLTQEQLVAITARTEAAHLPPEIAGKLGDYMVSAEGYTIEYADGDVLAHFSLDPSGEGDYEAYNRRQFAQVEFARYANRDVRALIAHLEQKAEQIATLERSLKDCAGRLGDASLVILAVKDWDEAGGDKGAETSRLLHNAYVTWHEAREKREANHAASR